MSMLHSTQSHPAIVSGRVGLIAGEGELPVLAAKNMLAKGLDISVYAIDKGNIKDFKRILPADKVHFIVPGLFNRNAQLFHEHAISGVVLVGKVNKWIILCRPVLDSRALALWRESQSGQRNDDTLMHAFIAEFAKENITVLPQTDYLENLFIEPGVYSRRHPTETEQQDIQMGLSLAKEMGRLDVGQTVVISNLMVIAIEAIEGTDQAILRSQKWIGKQGGVVVKVEKPNQDHRFDVPTVGPRTLKALRKAGLKVLAVEAGKTLVLDLPRMTALADQWGLSLVAL